MWIELLLALVAGYATATAFIYAVDRVSRNMEKDEKEDEPPTFIG